MTSRGPGATILVADDQTAIRTLLEVVLSADGHHVVSVADGREALAYLKTDTPDLAILDVSMPFVDGLDLCGRIKRVARLKDVPVIILTAAGDDKTRVGATSVRADALVNKPLSGKNLRQTVRELLRRAADAKLAASAASDSPG